MREECLHKSLYVNIYSNFILNLQELEATRSSLSLWTHEQTGTFTHGLQSSKRKKETADHTIQVNYDQVKEETQTTKKKKKVNYEQLSLVNTF